MKDKKLRQNVQQIEKVRLALELDLKESKLIMKKILGTLFLVSFVASGAYASGCSEMAAFNTKINKALKSASFNEKTLADIRNLQSECKRQHDMGMSVSSIGSCNKALDLVAVN